MSAGLLNAPHLAAPCEARRQGLHQVPALFSHSLDRKQSGYSSETLQFAVRDPAVAGVPTTGRLSTSCGRHDARRNGEGNKGSQGLHMTAAMRVLRFHVNRPALSVQDAHDIVKELAVRVGEGVLSREDQVLEFKLRRATGISAADLARLAEGWPAA